MNDYALLSVEELTSLTGTDGLQSSQVEMFRDRFGINAMTPPKREPVWRQYLEKYDDPIIKILIIAVIISAFVSAIQGIEIYDTIGIVVAILLATGIAFYNEYTSGREFEVLNAHRDDVEVKVVRDGSPISVPSRDIVVGDLIILEAGDAIPADGWLLVADAFHADESAFTGESEPVVRELHDPVLKGSFVTAGKGRMIAGAVGDSAQMGVIAASLGMEHAFPTPLEKKLETLAGIISKFGYTMGILILVSLSVRGMVLGELTGANLETLNNILHYLMVAVAIIVVAVPEGLPMSVALSLSLAMQKMTRANCLVRKLIACETIGSATTICTDKTGTLTKNQMQVVASSCGNPALPGNTPRDPCGMDYPQCCREWHCLS